MSAPAGSGYSEKEYDKRKRAHDALEQKLRDHGVSPEKAREKAREIAHRSDNENRSKGK